MTSSKERWKRERVTDGRTRGREKIKRKNSERKGGKMERVDKNKGYVGRGWGEKMRR